MSAGPAALAARSSRSVVCGGLAHLQCLPWSRCEPQHRPVRTLQPGQRRPNISTRGFGDRLLDYIEGGSPRSCCLDACLAGCARAPVLGLYVRKSTNAPRIAYVTITPACTMSLLLVGVACDLKQHPRSIARCIWAHPCPIIAFLREWNLIIAEFPRNFVTGAHVPLQQAFP